MHGRAGPRAPPEPPSAPPRGGRDRGLRGGPGNLRELDLGLPRPPERRWARRDGRVRPRPELWGPAGRRAPPPAPPVVRVPPHGGPRGPPERGPPRRGRVLPARPGIREVPGSARRRGAAHLPPRARGARREPRHAPPPPRVGADEHPRPGRSGAH